MTAVSDNFTEMINCQNYNGTAILIVCLNSYGGRITPRLHHSTRDQNLDEGGT